MALLYMRKEKMKMSYMKTEDNRMFYAPDSFDRATMNYCCTNATNDYVIGNLGSSEATFSFTIDSVNDSISELQDRVCTLEAAVAKSTQPKPPVSMQTWRYDRRSFKTLGADSRTPSLSRLFATN